MSRELAFFGACATIVIVIVAVCSFLAFGVVFSILALLPEIIILVKTHFANVPVSVPLSGKTNQKDHRFRLSVANWSPSSISTCAGAQYQETESQERATLLSRRAVVYSGHGSKMMR